MNAVLSAWVAPRPHDARRSVELVRVAVALILLSHPLHALVNPDDVRELAGGLAEHGLPFGLALAWLAIATQLVCAAALAARRFVVPAALGSIAVLAGGCAALYAPRWFVVGGRAEDGHPGVEFSVLLIGCLAGILWAYWPRRTARGDAARAADRGLEIIRVVSALALVPHATIAFLTWDVEGMRAWGEGMSQLGFPFGVALVWSIKSLELVCCVGRLARRLVVPACFGHLLILVPGMWISHGLHWFVVGPGENGVEFSLALIACAVACILAYWPARRAAAPGPAADAAVQRAT